MKNAKVSEVKQYLKTLDRDELEQLILKLYKNHKVVKNEISSIVLGEKYMEELLEDYKKKMIKEFNKRSSLFSIRTLNGYVSSFKKESGGNKRLYTDLLLFYCEWLIAEIEEFDFQIESIENSVIKSFNSVIDLVKNEEELYKLYEDRIRAIWQNNYLNDFGISDSFTQDYLDIPWISKEDRDWEFN